LQSSRQQVRTDATAAIGSVESTTDSGSDHPTDDGPQFFDWTVSRGSASRTELAATLSRAPSSISPKYFYDEVGSTLFTAICELPEYYPTRTEASILAARAGDIAAAVGIGSTLIDLGAGDCRKAAGLFGALLPGQYVAVDISVAFVANALHGLHREFPGLPMVGLGVDLARRLELPDAVRDERRVSFYPGSSIGNFMPDDAQRFLSRIRRLTGVDGGLLIGIDLMKSAEIIEPAYDDAQGITAAFNLNVLNVVNRMLDADFALQDWRHVAFLNEREQRIEMHLEASRALRVSWPGGGRNYAAGERIHTEYSYKHTLDGFDALLRGAGFGVAACWTDPREWFAVLYATPLPVIAS
jgi:dimethylhistidine N-methyltransferase